MRPYQLPERFVGVLTKSIAALAAELVFSYRMGDVIRRRGGGGGEMQIDFFTN